MNAQKSGGAVVSFQKFPLSIRLENAAVSYARYLGKRVWPAHLALFYPHPGSLALSAALLSLLLLLAISAAVYVYRPRIAICRWAGCGSWEPRCP